MSDRLPRTQRLADAGRWPLGLLYTSWSYVWRITPMHRRELEGTPDEDAPPALPDSITPEGVRRPDDGVGPLLHRVYTGRVRDARLSAEALMGCLVEDPNRASPTELAKFRKAGGEDGSMAIDDDYVVRMPGPWNGPVRVIEVTPRSFRFATLEGHLEAGQIEWRAFEDGDLVFQVESWARPGDRLSSLLHHRLRMGKEVQLHMWSSVVEQVAKLAGGRLVDGIDIDTRIVDADSVPA